MNNRQQQIESAQFFINKGVKEENILIILKGDHANKAAELVSFTTGGWGMQGEKEGTIHAVLEDGKEITIHDDEFVEYVNYFFVNEEVEE